MSDVVIWVISAVGLFSMHFSKATKIRWSMATNGKAGALEACSRVFQFKEEEQKEHLRLRPNHIPLQPIKIDITPSGDGDGLTLGNLPEGPLPEVSKIEQHSTLPANAQWREWEH
ncbi:hypothetical protein BJ742DRAFT_866821 [Cladochytrium replicatum]|nr:hypothetical protein BJ742DRAFT_866821 [Cladochytrium replicatum]